jgi:hypothetical protein
MIHLKLNLITLFLGLFTVVTSCSVFNKSEGRVIKGNYDVIKIENVNNRTPKLVCIIYDKQKSIPISYAIVKVDETKIEGVTKDDGTLEMDVPEGKYTITVMNGANTTIKTKLINFKPNTKTEIKFNLGTTYIY